MRCQTLVSFALLVALAGLSGAAQTPDAAFEVASVKRVVSPDIGYGIRPIDASGRFYAVITVYDLLRIAYGSPLALVESQVVDAPQWVKSDRFEITAKANGTLDQDRLYAMLRGLLADRFQLRVRKETRQLPVFDLVLDVADPDRSSVLETGNARPYSPTPNRISLAPVGSSDSRQQPSRLLGSRWMASRVVYRRVLKSSGSSGIEPD